MDIQDVVAFFMIVDVEFDKYSVDEMMGLVEEYFDLLDQGHLMALVDYDPLTPVDWFKPTR